MAALGVVVAGDVVCTRCVGTTDLADNGVTSAKILNGTILNADINAAAAIDPTKILGTAWTATNDGSVSGLDADLLDGVDSSVFLRNDTSGQISGTFSTTGYLGIGTASPGKPLTIAAGSNDAISMTSDASDDWYLGPNVVTAGFGIYDVTQEASRFQITTDGKVGIGIGSPTNNLDLVSTGNTKMLIHANDSVNDRNPELELKAGNSDAGAYSVLKFSKTAGTTAEKLRIQNGSGIDILTADGSGKVGVGTDHPADALSVYMPYSGDADTRISVSNDYVNMGMVGRSNSYGQYRLGLVDASGGETLSLYAGNVGIGTITPSEKLDVQGNIYATGTICGSAGCVGSSGVTGSGEPGRLAKWDTGGTSLAGTSMYISSDRLGVNTGGDPKIDLAVGDDDTGLEEVSDGKLAIYTNNTERLRISSDGNIGIGDTSPSSDLTIARDDTTSEGGELRLNGSGGAYNYLYIDNYKGKARIVTNDGSTDHVALTADANGYVGVGTSDPAYGLDVHAVGSAHQAIHATMNDPAPTANPFTIYADNYSTGDSTGSPVAVYGEEYATSPAAGGAFGVLGRTHSTSASGGSSSAGVWGGASGNDDATHGSHNGIANGIQGETWSTNNSAAGGRFYANTSTSGKAEAVYGYTDSTDTSSFSFEGHGPTVTTGTKSAAVYTDTQGPTELFTEESAGVWFSDYGTGQLVNGRLTVQIDPLFLQTVTINTAHPLEVFVQAYDPAQLYVKPGQTSFEVLALNDNLSTAKFSYRILAKRKYYEDVRLQPVEVSVDQFMRPDLNWDLIDALNSDWGLPADDPRQPTGPKMILNP